MTAPITPITIARLRELDAAATPVPWAADELHCSDGPWVSRADASLIAAMRNALPAILDQLAAQAAEIERGRVEADNLAYIFAQAGFASPTSALAGIEQLRAEIARWKEINARASDAGRCIISECDRAEARVVELTALIRSIYAQDVEDDQQSPVEDLLRHQAGEYGKARCRVRELERERAELEELLRKHAALACGACAGTGTYLGDEDRDGPCDVCGGTGSVLPEDVAAVLAGREGGR